MHCQLEMMSGALIDHINVLRCYDRTGERLRAQLPVLYPASIVLGHSLEQGHRWGAWHMSASVQVQIPDVILPPCPPPPPVLPPEDPERDDPNEPDHKPPQIPPPPVLERSQAD